MTLGEFASDIANEISDLAISHEDVHGVIHEASLLLEELPAPQMKWFWQEVAGQLTAHRPIDDGEAGERISAAIDQVLQVLSACGIAR